DNRHPYSILIEPRRLIGTTAAEMIKNLKGGGKVPKEQILIQGELMIRQSCSAPMKVGYSRDILEKTQESQGYAMSSS
ncbi:MAG: hypothetical protein WCP55_02370, partial [Lentisphaerota bacterium]